MFDRGAREGISELHVVERALTAGVSRRVREFFATDAEAIAAGRLLRRLRNVPLEAAGDEAAEPLGELRRAETWDDETVINSAFSPIANGDVFQCDRHEPEMAQASRRYILLGQPCDLTMRLDGTRNQQEAMLIPLKAAGGDPPREKTPKLPFKIDGQSWKLDLGALAHVRLVVLDLASVRADGRVRLDLGHEANADLLPGQHAAYPTMTASLDPILAQPAVAVGVPLVEALQLTTSVGDAMRQIRLGARKSALARVGDPKGPLPERIGWNLRRVGRVRPPYSAALLDVALSVMGRQAYDLEFEP